MSIIKAIDWNQAEQTAIVLGTEHGRNAADWWEQDAIGGRSTNAEETATIVLRMIEEGDPALWDTIPGPDLSGQWADGYTVTDLADDCGWSIVEGDEASQFSANELAHIYSQVFSDEVEVAVSEYCRAYLTNLVSPDN